VVEDATTVIDDVVNGVLNRAGMDPLTKTPQQQVAARYRVGD
jgi:hypothetical protein